MATDAEATAAGENSTLAGTVMREILTRAGIIVSGAHASRLKGRRRRVYD
jgi:hypothetical protein